MATLQSLHLPFTMAQPRVRHIDASDLDWALREGWKDFQAQRGDIIVLAVIYPLVGLIAAVAAFNDQLLPLFFPLIAGLSILGPAVASGFYEIARRREAGLPWNWLHFLDPLSGRNRTGLIMLTVGLVGLFAVWLLAAWLIYADTLGTLHPVGTAQFVQLLFTTSAGWSMIVLGNLVGFGFAVASLTLSLVSFPMVVDKPADASTAIATSLHAVTENPRVVALWGLRVAGLLLLGSLPGFIGLAVVLPVLGYATWHLYTRLVER